MFQNWTKLLLVVIIQTLQYCSTHNSKQAGGYQCSALVLGDDQVAKVAQLVECLHSLPARSCVWVSIWGKNIHLLHKVFACSPSQQWMLTIKQKLQCSKVLGKTDKFKENHTQLSVTIKPTPYQNYTNHTPLFSNIL